MALSTQHWGAQLVIDLGAIATNYRLLQQKASEAEIAAVVKADAYGLGMDKVATALAGAGCRTFFVATPEEGLALRKILPESEIHVFNGPMPGLLEDMIKQRITPVLNSLYQTNLWAKLANSSSRLPPVDLQLDTGMSRLGFTSEELDSYAGNNNLKALLNLDVILSHLACADDPESSMNQLQRVEFEAKSRELSANRRSLAASSGLFLGKQYHYDLVRAGVALYGGNPTPNTTNPMAQVLNIKAKIIQVRSVDTPQSVGYGATHRLNGPAQIATVALGYADGYLRSFSNAGRAWIDGHEVRVAGRVSMDLTTLDVTSVPSHLVYPGAEVEFIGPGQTIGDMAKDAGTIDHEIMALLGNRFFRNYIEG